MGIHDGHRKRLKAQFMIHGNDFLDHQLMELLLYYAIPQGDMNELSHTILNQFGGFTGVFDALPTELMKTSGIGEHSVALLKLIPILSSRYMYEKTKLGNILNSTAAAGAHLRLFFPQGTRNEMIYLACMDAKCKVLGVHKLSEGSVNSADITARRVAELALSHNATMVILAHNHISGIALPSNADLSTTRRLWSVLDPLGVRLVDHLIFVDDDMVSMKDSGIMSGYDR